MQNAHRQCYQVCCLCNVRIRDCQISSLSTVWCVLVAGDTNRQTLFMFYTIIIVDTSFEARWREKNAFLLCTSKHLFLITIFKKPIQNTLWQLSVKKRLQTVSWTCLWISHCWSNVSNWLNNSVDPNGDAICSMHILLPLTKRANLFGLKKIFCCTTTFCRSFEVMVPVYLYVGPKNTPNKCSMRPLDTSTMNTVTQD